MVAYPAARLAPLRSYSWWCGAAVVQLRSRLVAGGIKQQRIDNATRSGTGRFGNTETPTNVALTLPSLQVLTFSSFPAAKQRALPAGLPAQLHDPLQVGGGPRRAYVDGDETRGIGGLGWAKGGGIGDVGTA